LQYKQKFYYICGVNQKSVILLLALLLFPIIWNGISILHYAVAHSHTFCQSEAEHSHPTPDDCLSIFQLAENQSQSQLPSTTKIEFQELQQYLTPHLEVGLLPLFSFQQSNFINPSLPENLFSKDVFLPPIFA